MQSEPVRYGAFFVGGLFLAGWLYLALFAVPDVRVSPGAWFLYGLLGLAVAAGVHVARIASLRVRIAVMVALGVTVGMLMLAALFNGIGEAMAAALTLAGGGLIVSALPPGTRFAGEP